MEFSKLDMKLSELFQLKIKLNFFPAGIDDNPNLVINSPITRENNEFFINILLPKTPEYSKFSSFFSILGIQERPLYTIVRKSIQNNDLRNLLLELDNIDGLEISYTTIEHGYLIITGFMHSASTKAFSDIIYENLGKARSISKINLRPVEGFINYTTQHYKGLKSLTISLPMSVFGHYRVINTLKTTGAIAQFIDNYPIDGKFRIFIYADKQIRNVDGLEEISAEDHIYQTETDEDVFLKLTARAMDRHMTWNFLFMYADNEKLYMNFIVPDIRLREYFDLIIDTEMELKNLEWVVLEHYGDIDYNESGNPLITK
jgi:hypothetical protein